MIPFKIIQQSRQICIQFIALIWNMGYLVFFILSKDFLFPDVDSWSLCFGIFFQQKMKNSTIQLLHLGRKRRVQKQEYLKLRAYNKIKTCRSRQQDSQRLESTARSYEQYSYTAEKLVDVIDCLKKDNLCLSQENIKLHKEIKKAFKMDRMISKKFPSISDSRVIDEDQNLSERETLYLQNDYHSMLELKLSLDVVQLESLLQEKAETQKRLENSKRISFQHNVAEQIFTEKTRFLITFLSDKEVAIKAQALSQERNQIDESMQRNLMKQRNNKKIKASSVKNLELLKYEVKDLEKSAQERKKRIRKDSCQYIEIENGEVRNQQDILRELKEIQEKTKVQSESLQVFLQEKMLQKIDLINQIQKYESECGRMGLEKIERESNKSKCQSIKIIL